MKNLLKKIFHNHEKSMKLFKELLEELNLTSLDFPYRYYSIEPIIHPMTGEILLEFGRLHFEIEYHDIEIIFPNLYDYNNTKYCLKRLHDWVNSGFPIEYWEQTDEWIPALDK